MTVWDGGGNDTFDFSNYTTNLSVDLNPGQWTILDTSAAHAQRADLGNNGAGGPEYFARGNIANALLDPNNPNETASLIENAIGGLGNDHITGNTVDNTLTGGPGNDTIDGLGGTNTAVYSGPWAKYTVDPLLGGSFLVTDNRPGSPDGTDTDTNIQFFKFSDRTYSAAEVLEQPPVIQSGGGGDAATYLVGSSVITKLTQVVATDPNAGELITYSISGSGAGAFSIDPQTGILSFNSSVNSSFPGTYSLAVRATDEHGISDVQNLAIKVSVGLMIGASSPAPDIFAFHSSSINTVLSFDATHDFLQFDKGIFSADTAAAVLAAAQDTVVGADIATGPGLQVLLVGVSKADLAAHPSDIVFV